MSLEANKKGRAASWLSGAQLQVSGFALLHRRGAAASPKNGQLYINMMLGTRCLMVAQRDEGHDKRRAPPALSFLSSPLFSSPLLSLDSYTYTYNTCSSSCSELYCRDVRVPGARPGPLRAVASSFCPGESPSLLRCARLPLAALVPNILYIPDGPRRTWRCTLLYVHSVRRVQKVQVSTSQRLAVVNPNFRKNLNIS